MTNHSPSFTLNSFCHITSFSTIQPSTSHAKSLYQQLTTTASLHMSKGLAINNNLSTIDKDILYIVSFNEVLLDPPESKQHIDPLT
ncbi:hypothetical protein HK096_010630 [Nowakowskiella sp. JEL0078]|nr:hypothetical protein HK096_010630 [Nowakowskiella sp. JEL0078]